MARGRATKRRPTPSNQYADLADVQEFASTLGEGFLECRDNGHTWKRLSARWYPHLGIYRRVHRCRNCKSERWQELSDKGHILRKGIDYAEGYLLQGLGRVVGDGRDAMRLESMLRNAIEVDEDEE